MAWADPGLFAVICDAPTNPNGTPKPVRGNLAGGNDTFGTTSAVGVRVDGGAGDDVIIGNRGADRLLGRAGNDFLASNQSIGANPTDGAVDTLDGGSEFDDCKVPFPTAAEADVTVSCEAIPH